MKRRSNEPLTAGGRELRLRSRPPASLPSLITPWAKHEFHTLKSPKNCLDIGEHLKLFTLSEARLAELIRPTGYFNVKARRLRSFLRVLLEAHGGDLDRLFAGETSTVRERLLAINGIGPETADSMLLYAGGHHSFVIDAYTKRIFHRHKWCAPETDYDDLKGLCESSLNPKPVAARLDYWQDYHAQLVMVGKHFCRPREPLCDQCPLQPLLPRQD